MVPLWNPSIITKEAWDVAEVAIADQTRLVNDDDSQKMDDDPSQQICRKEIKIPELFNSHCEMFLKMTNEFEVM